MRSQIVRRGRQYKRKTYTPIHALFFFIREKNIFYYVEIIGGIYNDYGDNSIACRIARDSNNIIGIGDLIALILVCVLIAKLFKKKQKRNGCVGLTLT